MKVKKNIIIVVGIILICIIIALVAKLSTNTDKEENNTQTNLNKSSGLYSEDTEDIGISTSYGKLYYPKEWDKNLKTKNLKENGKETVQFWAKIEGKEKVHLFDVIFGGSDKQIGTIELDNGNKVSVSVVSYEVKVDKSWTDREKDIVYTMSEGINYTLDKLDKLKGFKKVE